MSAPMSATPLEVVIRHQPALVVSDIAMPGKDGFDCFKKFAL